MAVAASGLNDLHAARNRADYQMDRSDPERPANAQATAAALIQALDAAFRGPNRGQLRAASQQWRRANGYP